MKTVKCKVVMLSTEKASRLYTYDDGQSNSLHQRELGITSDDGYRKGKYLYITSDEDIKESDWIIISDESYTGVEKAVFDGILINGFHKGACRKVISTTDSSIINKTVNKSPCTCGACTFEGCSECIISTSSNLHKPTEGFIKKFIEKYNKGELISDILVEYIDMGEEYWLGDNVNGEPFWNENWELKVSSQNEITIHPIKQSWTKEEVTELIKSSVAESHDWSRINNDIHSISIIEKRFLDKWIKENL